MDRVLLLNVTYAPIRVISVQRAVTLILEKKAEILEESGRYFHSPSIRVAVPSVLRLNYMVKIPYKSSIALNRKAVLARDNGICQYGCGRKATTIDHVIPRSRGGRHDWNNVLASCAPCNAKKGHKLLSELEWKPLKKPHIPRGDIWLASDLSQQGSWSEYVS